MFTMPIIKAAIARYENVMFKGVRLKQSGS